MQTRPTLLNSCARATTAAESRFRIDVPLVPSRATRVVALDDQAAAVVRAVSEHPWAAARFFTVHDNEVGPDANGADPDDLRLRRVDGTFVPLVDELVDVDATVMVAANDDGEAAASRIGLACTLRGIMTAGLILGDGDQVSRAMSALRPHARVLMVPGDEEDLVQLLTALRA